VNLRVVVVDVVVELVVVAVVDVVPINTVIPDYSPFSI
jgi:hypothetical protein